MAQDNQSKDKITVDAAESLLVAIEEKLNSYKEQVTAATHVPSTIFINSEVNILKGIEEQLELYINQMTEIETDSEL